MHDFTLILNAGRSGSRYLFRVFEKNFADDGVFLHEALSGGEAQVRAFARAYDPARIESIAREPAIAAYIERISSVLEKQPLIEFGWRSFHLAPVFVHAFPGRFRCIFLHRHPVEYAASRAVMGFYGGYPVDYHELSPFDPHAIHTDFRSRWETMNTFEKCLYWWAEFMALCLEFRGRYPDVPWMETSSNTMFADPSQVERIAAFTGMPERTELDLDAPRNSVRSYTYEKWPLRDNWRRFDRHPEVVRLAEQFGYTLDADLLEPKMQKYQLPRAFWPSVRYYTRYWHIRHAVAYRLKHTVRRFGDP